MNLFKETEIVKEFKNHLFKAIPIVLLIPVVHATVTLSNEEAL